MSAAEPARPVIAVVGATATGKSDLAIALAEHLGGEVVNADASQLYRGMDIGTAKVPVADRRVRHHQLDVLSVTEPASVAAYQRCARADLADIRARGHQAVLVGGSGLYVKAVLDPLEFPGTDPRLRAELEARAHDLGPNALHRELADVDPVAAERIPAANLRRVVRALEVVRLTGRPFSATLPREEYLTPTVQIGLRRDPDRLAVGIEQRVHAMLADGFLDEVRSLLEQGLREGRTARAALGYAQLISHLDGRLSLDEAVTETINATKAFAKRQLKWFRRDSRISWLDADQPREALLEQALRVIQGQASPTPDFMLDG